MKATQELADFVDEIIRDAGEMLSHTTKDHNGTWVNPRRMSAVITKAQLLLGKLGPHGRAWKDSFDLEKKCTFNNALAITGILETIQQCLKMGRFETTEELVAADILGDLTEHAEELIEKKYMMAAAVILRAVLEERLRTMVTANSLPIPEKATIEDLKAALRKADIIKKVDAKSIDSMAGVGNAAAHNLKDEFNPADVPMLYKNTLAFLAKFSA